MSTVTKNSQSQKKELFRSPDLDSNSGSKDKLSISEIEKSIPSNSLNKPDPNLQNTHTEWRWRFFNINDSKKVEISKKDPLTKRQYKLPNGEWIEYDMDNYYDKYVYKSCYYYSKSN